MARALSARFLVGLVVGALIVIVLLGAFERPAFLGGTPGTDSAEAGFARDMQVHHAQAVEMASIVRERTDDPAVRTLAYDILTGQQHQIGQMFGWLSVWGLPQAASGERMAWMSATDHSRMRPGETMADMALDADGLMPGMATDTELDDLRRSRGVEAETAFLTLMIEHHRGGVAMARAALDLTDNAQVGELARAVVSSQLAEIRAMQDMLDERRRTTAGGK